MWTVIWRKVNKCIWASNGEWYLPNVSNICALRNVKYIFRSHCDERLQIQILAFFIIFFLIFWCHTTTQLMCQLSCALGCRAQKKEIGWKKPSHIYIWRWHSWSWNKMKRRMHLGSWFHTLAVGRLRRPRRIGGLSTVETCFSLLSLSHQECHARHLRLCKDIYTQSPETGKLSANISRGPRLWSSWFRMRMEEWERGGVRMSLGRWTLVSFERWSRPHTCPSLQRPPSQHHQLILVSDATQDA